MVDRRAPKTGCQARSVAAAGSTVDTLREGALPVHVTYPDGSQQVVETVPRRGDHSREWHFLCAVEVTNFAQLRRELGAARADALTATVADHIADLIPAATPATIARATIEFVVDATSFDALEPLLQSIFDVFDEPVSVGTASCILKVAVAGAAAPVADYDDVRAAEELEDALASARAERRVVGRNLLESAGRFDRLSLSRDLTGAADRGEMFLHYQPKVHVRRQHVSSAEALIRWNHPVRGLIYPGDFIGAAEESGEIAALTLWTLDQVVADRRVLQAAGHDIEIFVNISGRLLADRDFVAEAAARAAGMDGRIGFEITETSVIRDPDVAIAHLQQFAEMGIPIAIDDYGAGLSSLAYLKQLPARELKIDKMFITQLTSSNRDPLIVRSTIDLAHALDMEVTAEGVETRAALALLSVMGCDMVQGFLISRPVALSAFQAFLDTGVEFVGDRVRTGSFNQPASFWKRA